MPLPPLTPDQRQRIWDAFFAIDMHPWTSHNFIDQGSQVEDLSYDGDVSLAGLWHVYEVCAAIHAEQAASTATE